MDFLQIVDRLAAMLFIANPRFSSLYLKLQCSYKGRTPFINFPAPGKYYFSLKNLYQEEHKKEYTELLFV